jgi:hypothetical protein
VAGTDQLLEHRLDGCRTTGLGPLSGARVTSAPDGGFVLAAGGRVFRLAGGELARELAAAAPA